MPVPAYPALAAARLLTVAEVAGSLAVCRATVFALFERAELPHLRVGNNVLRITAADLAAYVARQRMPGRD